MVLLRNQFGRCAVHAIYAYTALFSSSFLTSNEQPFMITLLPSDDSSSSYSLTKMEKPMINCTSVK